MTWWSGKFSADHSRSIERIGFTADQPSDWQLGIGLSSYGIDYQQLPLVWTSGIIGEGLIPWNLLPEGAEITATVNQGERFVLPTGEVAEYIPDLPVVVLAKLDGDIIDGATIYKDSSVEVKTDELDSGTYILWVIRAPSRFRVTVFQVL
jgi:hypothetical protein